MEIMDFDDRKFQSKSLKIFFKIIAKVINLNCFYLVSEGKKWSGVFKE